MPIDEGEVPPLEEMPGLFSSEEITPPPIQVPEPALPLVPAIVRLQSSQRLLRPGDTAQLTVRVWQHDDWETELTLRVDLPAQLQLVEEQPLTWTLPP